MSARMEVSISLSEPLLPGVKQGARGSSASHLESPSRGGSCRRRERLLCLRVSKALLGLV